MFRATGQPRERGSGGLRARSTFSRHLPPARPAAEALRPHGIDPLLVAALTSGKSGGLIVAVRAKQMIFRQGEAAEAIYYVESGKIRLNAVSVQGREGVVAIVGPGEFFGERALASHAVRTTSAVAMTPTSLVKVPRRAMARLVRHEPAVRDAMLAFLLSRNAQIEADLIDHLCNSSEQRLARVLLLLGDFANGDQAEAVVPRLSQGVLAAKVGTTRSRINFFMNKFRRLGLIEYDAAHKSLKVRSSLLDVIVDR
jgi:CRP-like cAMP-binding protein